MFVLDRYRSPIDDQQGPGEGLSLSPTEMPPHYVLRAMHSELT
jgi:hypothetical protein